MQTNIDYLNKSCTDILSNIFYRQGRLRLNYVNVVVDNYAPYGAIVRLSFDCSNKERTYITKRLPNFDAFTSLSTTFKNELIFRLRIDLMPVIVDPRSTVCDKIINDVMTDFFPKLLEVVDEFDFDSEVTNLLATEYN